MSRALPDRIKFALDPQHTVIWWGRRAGLEVVEEISRATFSTLVILFAAIWLNYWFSLSKSQLYWVGVVSLTVWYAKVGIIEVLEWRNEIYVVTQNGNDKGGKIHKFYGWLNHRHISDAITPQSPAVGTSIPFGYRLWRFFTGQRIVNFSIHSANHGAFLNGRKISNQIEWALIMVRGSKPKQANGEVGFEGVDDLIRLHTAGGISRDEFKDYSRKLVQKKLYG